MLLLLGQPHFTNASAPVRGITDPLLALQMARDVNEVEAILADAPSPDREVMRIKVRVGFALLTAYAALFATLGMGLRRHTRLGAVIAALGILAAAFDAGSGFASLRLIDVSLAMTTDALIARVHALATLKWSLLSLSMVFLAIPCFDSRRWHLRGLGAINFLAGAILCLGLYNNALLPGATVLWALALLASAATLKLLTHEPAS